MGNQRDRRAGLQSAWGTGSCETRRDRAALWPDRSVAWDAAAPLLTAAWGCLGVDLASPSSTLTCRGLHWPNVPETGGQGAWSMSIWTSPGGTERAGGGGTGGAMAPCRLLSHWDPHSAWWPTQPTELGAQPSNASSPVQSMVLWSERAPRLVGPRVTRDITHQL